MHKAVPLTKLILTFAVTIWAMMIKSLLGLGVLVIAQILIIIICGEWSKTYKGIASLGLFAILLSGLQYLLGVELTPAIAVGLRMMSMTLVFIILLATTRLQDLTATMVTQLRIPYEYAFMLTAALRFIPDFVRESKAVQEAQACRGYNVQGNPFRKLLSYLTVVQPMVLRAISHSETMAMSLELRGFCSKQRTFASNVKVAARDCMILVSILAVTIGITAF